MESEMERYLSSTELGGYEAVSVALSFVTDDEMARLNARYRGIPEPTDVLSFPLWEEGGVFSPPAWGDDLPLGDVVISPERVRQDALDAGASYEGEMAMAAIHGFLHLIGFDHDTEERRASMWEVQERLRGAYLLRRAGGESRTAENWED
jgi:probable rRNA maturation factor